MHALELDEMPALVAAFVRGRADGAALLAACLRHVATVSRSYPAAYFALGQKNTESVDDLGRRVFSTCARVEKGRFPFMGRTPFRAYVEEQFDGRTIRYHSFYAKLSITREILRADYAHNLASDPQLAFRADLYADIGRWVRQNADRVDRGPGLPPRWALPGPVGVRGDAALVESLRRAGKRGVPELVADALRRGGPRTQGELAAILEEVIGLPESPRDAAAAEPRAEVDVEVVRGVRAAVFEAWNALEPGDQALLRALAEGLSYDEICARHPRFAHKVAVNRAVERISKGFVEGVLGRAGGAGGPAVPPREVMELVLDVLGDLPGPQTAPPEAK